MTRPGRHRASKARPAPALLLETRPPAAPAGSTLAGLGATLNHPVPASLDTFYGSFFSDPITVPSPWGALS